MSNNSPEKLVKAIHRRTRRKYSAEEKSVLSCKDFEAKTASLSYAAVRG